MDTLTDTRPIARKTHRCDVCFGVIGKGDQYHRQRNAEDGQIWTWKGHRLCEAIMLTDDAFLYLEPEDTVDSDSVREVLRDIFAALAQPFGKAA